MAGAGHRSPSLLAALLLRAALPPALLAATSHASSLPEDPLDTDAFLADVGVSTEGVPLCAFGNGTRTTPLPTGFFGPEPCVFESGMVLRANDPLGGKGAAAGALVWGFSKPGAMVSCAVGGAPPVTATADGKGRWELVCTVDCVCWLGTIQHNFVFLLVQWAWCQWYSPQACCFASPSF